MPVHAMNNNEIHSCDLRNNTQTTTENIQNCKNEQHEYYGAGEGDESGDLCPLMLQVVLDLFDGVDYEDP
ncbi:hypothetical protein E4T42_07543 [Aureobasidium subglaciale]|nr:hypothetical protein E4T42_07543 [Aureobasidium subglaciale]